MKTFCLTLPETPWRQATAEAHFKERGVDAEFIYGLDGVTSGLMTAHIYAEDHPRSAYRLEGKHVSLCLGHWMLWNVCLHHPDEEFLILEDDAVFEEKWLDRWNAMRASAPDDFDIILIGSALTADKPKRHIAGEIWEVKYPFCTHAYIVARKALQRLINTQRRVWAPIDIALMKESYQHLNVLTVLPRIVSQRGMDLAP